MKAGIINVTGYAGVELARILYGHPEVELTSVTGRSAAGQKLGAFFPGLARLDLTITPELGEVDIAFSCMPHKESVRELLPLIKKGVKVVDVSADFRLKDPAAYESWYGFTHPAPELLDKAVYGLTELYRRDVAKASLIANPGCYPTSAILAMAPALAAGLVKPDVIVDAKSGVSGAGRGLSLTTHYCEANEDVSAYSLGGHRHLPEMTQEMTLLAKKKPVAVTFIPHLVPMTRGILSTCYAPLAAGKLPEGKAGAARLMEVYRDFYAGEPFVRVVEAPPHTKHTMGNNMCLVYPVIDARAGRLVVISCLDNLIKGAGGQAVQNMNVMMGWPETMGLESLGIYP